MNGVFITGYSSEKIKVDLYLTNMYKNKLLKLLKAKI